MRPRRNDPCHCGSGRKYKQCHLDIDRDAERAFVGALPTLREKMASASRYERRLRDEYGVFLDYVPPAEFQGRKVQAIGSRLYLNRPPNETFHEFILHVLAGTFGEPWRAGQAAQPIDRQHFVYRCFEELRSFKAASAEPDELARHRRYSAEPNGWVRYLISLAWDVATLIHASNLPDQLVDRLRDPVQYQGARYEIAIAAIFARLDCSIRFLDEDEGLRGRKRVEFEAVHRPTGQAIAVEAKSRHRPGVLNEPGDPNAEDPLRSDARMVRRLFKKAVEKAPAGMPYFIFIDINAPLDAEVDERWRREMQAWIGRLPMPTPQSPDEFNALYVTNFSPHYDGDDISRGGSWLASLPFHVQEPLTADLHQPIQLALNTYGRVPSIEQDDTLLE